ncbi:MAG: PH domain-containing protein [Peptostreptococcaceae bacterium]
MKKSRVRKRFYSKKDLWITILFVGGVGFYLIEVIKDMLHKPNLYTVVHFIIILFISWFVFGTYYEFKEEYLLIKAGPLKDIVYYSDITAINEKRTFLVPIFLSTERIEIIYNGRLYGYISPKYKTEFLEVFEEKCLK